jgi:hypothetical protein
MSLIRRFTLVALSAVGVTAGADTAFAGWNNVAQLTCGDCRPRTSYRIADDCCEKPEVRRSYVQRTYYQPVTEWKCEKYLEPVQVKVRSSFYEPVTSYTYSSYYDPCSGECQRIATPHTSYRLRTECNTALKYVERTRMVPVETLKPVTVMQPVVSYYYPPRRVNSGRLIDPSELQDAPAPRPIPQTDIERTGGQELIPNPSVPAAPPKNMPSGTSRARTASLAKAAAIRGEVVERDRKTPRANTKVIFLNAADGTTREETQTNEFGEFSANLPAGEWHLYLGTGTGKAGFHSTLKMEGGQTRDVTVASR